MTDKMETVEDFCVLLRSLSRYLEGLGSGATGIDDVLLRRAGALRVRGPEPGRPGLAERLQGVLEDPLAELSEPAPLGGGPRSAASPGQLRTSLVALAADFARDRRLWSGDGGG
ncbi:hypothetical protein ACFY9A_01245 [Streptomyces rubradiris]|uniref:hypothetical protein n=1 Tax=Streptomyces rubradiris TaxID=285531 RepID=UPI0036F0EFB2